MKFGIPRVSVINDFAAAASGVELLDDSELAVLQTGEPVIGAPRLVIGAGTGLGVAWMIWAGDRYHVVPGEGGHAGFSPTTSEQADLWRDLHARVGRVGAEQVVSGPGLVRIYEYLERAAGRTLVPGSTSPGAIVDGAVGLHDAPKMRALDLFIECYGEIAGSLALAIMARGGVYIAGGIAPRVISRLRAGGFLAAFNSKGVHSDVARKIPVSVVMNDRLGVLGCALIAARMNS